jgi:hypothetical protein
MRAAADLLEERRNVLHEVAKTALCPRASVFDKSRRDVVLDITDLAENKIDPDDFFAENYLTDGMKRGHRLQRIRAPPPLRAE